MFSDRSLKPHYPEFKHAYQWLTIRPKDAKKGVVTIKNRYQFLNLTDLTAKWELSEDGTTVATGALAVGPIAPGKEKDLTIPYHVQAKPGAEYFLRVSFALAADQRWAKKGYEVAAPAPTASLALTHGKEAILVSGSDFKLAFSKAKGTFTKLEKSGENLLHDNGGPMLLLWRAPHRIDDMWAFENWDKYGLQNLTWTADNVSSRQVSLGTVEIKASLTGTGKQNFVVQHQVVYTINGAGNI